MNLPKYESVFLNLVMKHTFIFYFLRFQSMFP